MVGTGLASSGPPHWGTESGEEGLVHHKVMGVEGTGDGGDKEV